MIAFKEVVFYAQKEDSQGIKHMFPVDVLGGNHETAERWATIEHRGEYDYQKHEYIGKPVKYPPEVFKYENKGFDNVTIVDLNYRGNGGRAYQIVIEIDGNKFKMDMREDTMMEVLENVGIQAGGRLNGTYCLVKSGAETKIILEGTERHKEALKELETRTENSKTIKKSDLIIGRQYKTHGGASAVYLGEVYSASTKDDVLSKPFKAMLWYTSDIEDAKNLQQIIEQSNNAEDFVDIVKWNIEIKKSHSYKVESEQAIENVDVEKMVKTLNSVGKHFYNETMTEKWNGYSDWNKIYALNYYALSEIKIDKKDFDMKQEIIDEVKAKHVEAQRQRGRGYW